MKRALLVACCLLGGPTVAWGQWVLDSSSLTYHVSHPLHHTEGTSRAARGKGVCQAGFCDFLIAVPLKSFDSGDSNRDLHMLQAARGGDFPMVVVRTRLPEPLPAGDTLYADLEIQFAGETARYSHVPLHELTRGSEIEISGTIPATLTDFKIPPPSLLTIPVKNEIPVDVDTTWHKER